MDKLKQNAFALSLSGIGVVLLAAAYFLVYSPYAELSAVETRLADATSDLKRYESEPPTELRLKKLRALSEAERDAMDSAIAFYDRRAGSFRRFFGEDTMEPSQSVFAGVYNDTLNGLIAQYREKFEPAADRNGTQPPKIENSDPHSDPVPESQKKFWILQAILESALEHDIGGIQVIKLEKIPQASRRADDKKPAFVASTMDVTITANVAFSKLTPFLRALYSNARVPFVDARAIEVKKTPDQIESFMAASVALGEDDEGFSDEYDMVIPEPQVSVKMTLSVLDWGGEYVEEEAVEDEVVEDEL